MKDIKGERLMDIEKMARYWSEDADNYGKIIEDELSSFRVGAWQELLKKQMPKNACEVLDFGCGPGFFSIILADMGYKVTAIDCSEGMLSRARKNAESAGLSDKITFKVMDVSDMDFPDGSFDAVLSRNVTWTLSDPRKVYADVYRVLRPLGRVLLFDANWQLCLYDEALDRENNRRHEECIRIYGADFESDTPISEPFDARELPLSGVKRPYWDVEALRMTGFRNAHAVKDLTATLWDEKEKLLYGETPLFGVFGDK